MTLKHKKNQKKTTKDQNVHTQNFEHIKIDCWIFKILKHMNVDSITDRFLMSNNVNRIPYCTDSRFSML